MNSADGGWFNNRTECFSVVYASLLTEALSNQTGLMPLNGAIWIFFDAEDPFAAYGLSVWGQGYQGPGVIFL